MKTSFGEIFIYYGVGVVMTSGVIVGTSVKKTGLIPAEQLHDWPDLAQA